MAKRTTIDEMKELLEKSGNCNKDIKKATIKEVAEMNGVSVPTSFYTEFKATKRGYYHVPYESITTSEEVNKEDIIELSDDEFDLVVREDGMGIIKQITVTDKITKQSYSTSISHSASEESIRRVFNHYKRALRHL